MYRKTSCLICILFSAMTAIAQTKTTEIWANQLNTDIGIALKSAISSFGSTGGTVRIACGAYTTAVGNITVNYANISIEGQNSNCVSITYTGTTDFIRVQMKPFTIVQAGKISGLTISCSDSCAASDNTFAGIHIGDVGGFALDDIVATKFTGPNESGFWFDNVLAWTERSVLSRVYSHGNTKGFRFTNSGGTNVTASFAYTRMLDIRCNIYAGQTCLSFEGGRFAHSYLSLIANSRATSTTLIAVSGVQYPKGPGTSVDSSEFFVTAETSPGPATNLNIAANTFFNTCGFIDYQWSISTISGTLNSFLCYQTTGGYSGLYSNGEQLIAGQPRNPLTTMSPEFNGVGGFLNNGWFNGKEWQFNSNGKNNGGSAFLGTNSEMATFYSIPTNSTPESAQEVAPTLLNSYRIAGFNHLDWIFYRGIWPEGSGAKHRRFGATCTTPANPGSACTSTYKWTVPFIDASYTPVCWGQGAKGSPILSLAAAQSPNSITVQVQTATGVRSSFDGVDCVVMHD